MYKADNISVFGQEILQEGTSKYCGTFSLKQGKSSMGAQWPSGRVLDSRQKGSGFEPHLRHCVVVLEQDTFILALYWLNSVRPVPVQLKDY